MEKIVKLLFATTLLTIFAYILIFASVGLAGNGGEYWGYDGNDDPTVLAGQEFEGGDYRFLMLDFDNLESGTIASVPAIESCRNHPLEPHNYARPTQIESKHGQDSYRLAYSFARTYNSSMAFRLNEKFAAECERN